MGIVLNANDSAVSRGIKTVGIGKKGSQDLSPQLAQEILEELKSGKVSAAARGAFFAGLFFKGVSAQEKILETAFGGRVSIDSSDSLVRQLTADAPEFVQWICLQIMNKNTLDKETAYHLGQFLFSDEPGDGARGLIASALRVRYETDDEYQGLLQAMEETVAPQFRAEDPSTRPIIQLAEPFDGVDHSYMITPLLGKFLQGLGFSVVHLVGRNSGPKFIFNLADIATELNSSETITGKFLHQKDLSPAIDRWVELRHQTIKRPFLATLERFLNPLRADILAVSAFHPPYGEKMLTVAERSKISGAIVVRNGVEGTMAFPLKREVRLLCSAQMRDGTYKRHEIIFNPEEFLGYTVPAEEKLELPSLKENVRLLRLHLAEGKTDNLLFDARIKATSAGFEQALEWIKEQRFA